MQVSSTQDQLDLARNANDLSGVNALREAVNKGDGKALEAAANQFEAIFVKMMLQSMRKAQDALADEDSPFNSQQVKFYRDMHDTQLASDLSAGGGVGLAEIIVQQLSHDNDKIKHASTIRDGANLPVRQVSANEQREVLPPAPVQGAYKAPAFDSPDDFVASLYPHAKQAAESLGIDPKALIAQAAVETGWGQHVIHSGDKGSTNNLFGIKANRDWQGEQAVVDTLEFKDGVAAKQKAPFRAYDSVKDALTDYVDFIKGHARYDKAVQRGQDTQGYFQELQQAGYATDPKYADKIMSVMDSEPLKGFMSW